MLLAKFDAILEEPRSLVGEAEPGGVGGGDVLSWTIGGIGLGAHVAGMDRLLWRREQGRSGMISGPAVPFADVGDYEVQRLSLGLAGHADSRDVPLRVR